MTGAVAIVSRLAAAVFGGYAATAGGVTLLATLLPRFTPLSAADAVMLATMCGFPAYLFALLWALSHPDPRRVWLVLTSLTVAGAFAIVEVAPA